MESSEELFDELKNTEFETEESQKKVGRPKKAAPTKPYHRRLTEAETAQMDEYLQRIRTGAENDKKNPNIAEAFFLLGKLWKIAYIASGERQPIFNIVKKMQDGYWHPSAMEFATKILNLRRQYNLDIDTQNLEEKIALALMQFDIQKINNRGEQIGYYFTLGETLWQT